MSTTDAELYDCAVCENKTQLRCDACREVYFCSRECQRMSWSTHKWTCGKLALPFTFPPLTPLETADLQRNKNEHCSLSPLTGRPLTLLEELIEGDLFGGNWKELLQHVAAPPHPRLPNVHTFTRTLSHYFLGRVGTQAFPSPWRHCGIAIMQMLPVCKNLDAFEQISPFLHQYLIHNTLLRRFSKLPEQVLTGQHAKLLILAHNRATSVLITLDIDEAPGAALRLFWKAETEKLNEDLRLSKLGVQADEVKGVQM